MLKVICYYRLENPPIKFCRSIDRVEFTEKGMMGPAYLTESEELVEVVAYCLMPTHVHLVLKQLKEKGVSIFMNNVLNSYTRYFNIKHKRKGPLWEGRFRRILVKDNRQLLHLTRYIHLNPVTAYLINHPEQWMASSYHEYILESSGGIKFCKFMDLIEMDPLSYKSFVGDRASYQRELANIKKLSLE